MKKKIIITGGNGLLGSYFNKKYKKEYKIYKYPYRIENIRKFKKWISNKQFDYFIHFAAKTSNKNKKVLDKVNTLSSIRIIEALKNKTKFSYFLFISSSHVYNFSNIKIKETNKLKPISYYGLSKKKVEDYILKNKNKFNFKIGIARIFNFTSHKQAAGHFVPDIYQKIKKNKHLINLNSHRDFIHIDDISRSLNLMIKKKYDRPLNICSGKKINLISLSNKLNQMSFKKKIIFKNLKTNKISDLYGNNRLLKNLGIKKFRNLNAILKSFLYEKR